MAKKSFYGVKGSLKPKIYTSWPECQRAVKGVSGVLFKGFVTRAEAEAWIYDDGGQIPEAKAEGLYIYVDGSFSPSAGVYSGWGFVAVQDGEEIHSEYGATEAPALSRNIDGELVGSYRAALWCERNDKCAVICHDYEGVGRWALREWKANSEIAKWYQKVITPHMGRLRFKKVSAHSGDKWNDRADYLAKKGIGLEE
jgi:ribonuclease HI